MAITVERSSIDAASIAKALTVRPELTFAQKTRGYKADVIRFWLAEGAAVHVPFAWARRQLQVGPRPEASFDLYRAEPFAFRGQLHDDQLAPAQEALAALRATGGVTLAMRTGFGKTVVGTWLAAQLPQHVVLVVYTIGVCERQWAEAFAEFTDAVTWRARKEKIPPDGFHVVLCTVGTLGHIPPEVMANVGVLLIDEVHTFYTQIRTKALLGVRPRYVVALSATPEKENKIHRALELLVGSAKVTVPGRIFAVRQVFTGFRPTCERDAEGSIVWNTLVDSLVESPERNAAIAAQIARLVEGGHKPLVMTARVNHSEVLASLIGPLLPGRKVSIFQGNMKEYEDGAVLIGTKGKLSTGFDEKAFVRSENGEFKRISAVVVTFPINDSSLLVQVVGRAFRTSDVPLVVEFRDNHPATERHARKRCKIYRSLGVTVETEDAVSEELTEPRSEAASEAPDAAEKTWLAARLQASNPKQPSRKQPQPQSRPPLKPSRQPIPK